jgi:acetyl-CoA carboxylase carboxyl transferase subunit beta
MSWLTNFVRPKLRALVNKKEIPDNMWTRCPSCEQLLFHRDLAENLQVCNHCGHHLRLRGRERLAIMFDNQQYTLLDLPKVVQDPLKFRDLKKYTDRLRESRAQTQEDDALLVASGLIGGITTVVAVFDFAFMGGSMGAAVGEGLVEAANRALSLKAPLIVVPASGGARMQEGILSLMQMPRTTIAILQLKKARLPYITLLTDPTMGGVAASFAMLGDIAIAEPGSMIGFAGARVIQQIVRESLPPGFQKAEYLKEHGMIDRVVERKLIKSEISTILQLLMVKRLAHVTH